MTSVTQSLTCAPAVNNIDGWATRSVMFDNMATQRRGVGAIRLSSLTEDTTSPARQRELIQSWADANDVLIVGWAEDLDVSAKITPWERPELGPWLNEKHDQYELIIFAKLDRAVRSLNDFVDLDRWGQPHGVYLVILAPMIDMSNMYGRAMGQVFAVFAELERNMIAQRTKEGYEELLQTGRWPGGRVPYGYKTVRRPGQDGHWLEINQEQAEILRKIIDQILGGASTLSQVRWLNDNKIPTARGAEAWQHTSLYDILKSRALLGQRPTADGDVDRDSRGLPIQRAEPIVSMTTWTRLQATLRANSQKTTGNRYDGAPLLRVAFCGRCERPLYRRGVKRKGAGGKLNSYFYYRCASASDSGVETCPDKPYRAGELEKFIFDDFLDRVGPLEVHRKIFIPGEDHTEALETAQGAYSDLSEQLTTTRSSSARATLTERLSDLDELIASLEAKPNRPAEWRHESTGQTYLELWKQLEGPDRGALLREAGVQAYVQRIEGVNVVRLILPEDLEQRAQAWAAGRQAKI